MKIQELFRNQAKALRNCCGLVWSVPWQPLYLNTWSSISAAILEVCGIFRKWTSLEEVSHWRQAMRHGLTSDLLSAPWLQKQCDGHPMALQPSLSPPQRSVDPQSVNQEKAFLSPSSCLLPGHSSKKSSYHSSSLRASEERRGALWQTMAVTHTLVWVIDALIADPPKKQEHWQELWRRQWGGWKK